MADPLDLTTRDIDLAVNSAFERGHAVVVGYNGDDGYANLSFRGSARVYSPTQLAIWARKPGEGIAKAIESNPKVSVLYFGGADGPGPRFLSFRGSAHADPAASEAFHAQIPEPEQQYGPVESGVAVIIDVESVQGFAADGAFELSA